jgi:uncharacterized RDD family membrane protein YckC
MKCPKCEYLGFESSDRCRNCGYEFSFSQSGPGSAPSIDRPLYLADSEPLIPSLDSQLHMRPAMDLDQIIGSPRAPLQDLPLFRGDGDDGIPLVNASSRPRAPLGVRRATPEIPRARIRAPRPHEETLFQPARASMVAASGVTGEPAAPASRIVAALVDAALLLALDVAVIYFTLRLCGLTASELVRLPAAPLLAFLALLDGGYFVAFTAVSGQSIGKMALGIKVVGDEDRPVPVGRATVRTLAYFLSALPLGAGFLAGVFGADRLALHDRLARTRVVRPSSV